MGVQLNIKDAETVRLARDLADASGRSVTETIRVALEREVARRSALDDAFSDGLENILRETRGHWKTEFNGVELSTAHGDLLYDDAGLPK